MGTEINVLIFFFISSNTLKQIRRVLDLILSITILLLGYQYWVSQDYVQPSSSGEPKDLKVFSSNNQRETLVSLTLMYSDLTKVYQAKMYLKI